MKKLHTFLGWVKVLYLVLLPALAMWGMRDVLNDHNGIWYFLGGMFCVALYLGVATELTGLLHTVRQQAMDLVLTLVTLGVSLLTSEGQRAIAVIWLYEVAGILVAIFLLIAAKQPLEKLAQRIAPHQVIHMPHGGFPGWGIVAFFSGIAMMFIAMYFPILQSLQPWIALPLILWSGLLNVGRIMFSDRQTGVEGSILLGVFAFMIALGLGVAF